MKMAAAFLLAVLIVAAVFISGCVQQTGPPEGELTSEEAENQAYLTVEQEMEDAIESMTLEELENELLNQG